MESKNGATSGQLIGIGLYMVIGGFVVLGLSISIIGESKSMIANVFTVLLILIILAGAGMLFVGATGMTVSSKKNGGKNDNHL